MSKPEKRRSLECLVVVARGLVRVVVGDVEVVGLGVGEFGQLEFEVSKVRTRDLFIKLLGEHVAAKRFGRGPYINTARQTVAFPFK